MTTEALHFLLTTDHLTEEVFILEQLVQCN